MYQMKDIYIETSNINFAGKMPCTSRDIHDLVPPLLKIRFFALSQSILQVGQQIWCLDPCFQGQQLL